MNKINEATFFIRSSLKKDRLGAFEIDEGGPEKPFFFYLASYDILSPVKICKLYTLYHEASVGENILISQLNIFVVSSKHH